MFRTSNKLLRIDQRLGKDVEDREQICLLGERRLREHLGDDLLDQRDGRSVHQWAEYGQTQAAVLCGV